jgi:hypothetical protein
MNFILSAILGGIAYFLFPLDGFSGPKKLDDVVSFRFAQR